jgi:hypothetical protein
LKGFWIRDLYFLHLLLERDEARIKRRRILASALEPRNLGLQVGDLGFALLIGGLDLIEYFWWECHLR